MQDWNERTIFDPAELGAYLRERRKKLGYTNAMWLISTSAVCAL